MPRPFAIFTLRRTGGTTLTGFLTRVAEGARVVREPFNADHEWGHVAHDFRQSWDRLQLRRQIGEVLADRPSLKHCVEVVPPALSAELARACVARGYAVFVLQRRSERDRLMSLFLAMSTGAWGPGEAAEIYPRIRVGEMSPKRIDLDAIKVRAKADMGALGAVLLELRAARAEISWLVFEEIFAEPENISERLGRIARHIGVELEPNDWRLEWMQSRRGQGSAGIEARVPGAPQVRSWLERKFDPREDA